MTFVFLVLPALSCRFEFLWMVGGECGWVVPRDYFVSSQLQLWLFCCWGRGCCWAVTILDVLLTSKKNRCFALKVTKLEHLQANEQVSNKSTQYCVSSQYFAFFCLSAVKSP